MKIIKEKEYKNINLNHNLNSNIAYAYSTDGLLNLATLNGFKFLSPTILNSNPTLHVSLNLLNPLNLLNLKISNFLFIDLSSTCISMGLKYILQNFLISQYNIDRSVIYTKSIHKPLHYELKSLNEITSIGLIQKGLVSDDSIVKTINIGFDILQNRKNLNFLLNEFLRCYTEMEQCHLLIKKIPVIENDNYPSKKVS